LRWYKSKQLTGRLGPSKALLELPPLKVLEGSGEERLGDEGVLRGMGVGLGEVVEGLDGHVCVLFEDAAEAAEEADA
jgi:hypothetical protein